MVCPRVSDPDFAFDFSTCGFAVLSSDAGAPGCVLCVRCYRLAFGEKRQVGKALLFALLLCPGESGLFARDRKVFDGLVVSDMADDSSAYSFSVGVPQFGDWQGVLILVLTYSARSRSFCPGSRRLQRHQAAAQS